VRLLHALESLHVAERFNVRINGVKKTDVPFYIRQNISGANALFRQALSVKRIDNRGQDLVYHRRFDRGFHGDAAGFVRTLVGKFVNPIRGWRRCFSDDCLQGVSFGEFAVGCKKAGYTGNISLIWKELTRRENQIIAANNKEDAHGFVAGKLKNQDRLQISYFDVDPETVKKLHTFACMVDVAAKRRKISRSQLWREATGTSERMR